MAESRWISPSSIHTSLCLVASRLLPRPTKGPRVLQRGTGGPRSARVFRPLSPRSFLRPQSRWRGVPEAKRLRGQAATYRLLGSPVAPRGRGSGRSDFLERAAFGRLPARSCGRGGRHERPADEARAKCPRQLLRRCARHRFRPVGSAAGGDGSRPRSGSRRLCSGSLL
ncbi:hypothetical protein NDU88_005381 [Pleurodeles waltl]|uniref:Uncharacterized protein n=1 Tax=Pleurodeles waltl TaxID=8319 RepID=A0AAV7PFT1_PLEWA|nr:hypothetical protein NDU88_005381 [Pleurodeles waltl]